MLTDKLNPAAMDTSDKNQPQMTISDNKSNHFNIAHPPPYDTKTQTETVDVNNVKRLQLFIEGMSCASCVGKIENSINKLDGK